MQSCVGFENAGFKYDSYIQSAPANVCTSGFQQHPKRNRRGSCHWAGEGRQTNYMLHTCTMESRVVPTRAPHPNAMGRQSVARYALFEVLLQTLLRSTLRTEARYVVIKQGLLFTHLFESSSWTVFVFFICSLKNFAVKIICSRENVMIANSSWTFVKCSTTTLFQNLSFKNTKFSQICLSRTSSLQGSTMRFHQNP